MNDAKPASVCTSPGDCSPDRVPESDRKMIFHVCQQLAVVLGLNAQERAWLESLGANVSETNAGLNLSGDESE